MSKVLFKAKTIIIQLDFTELLRDVHCVRLALGDYVSQCLGFWQHIKFHLIVSFLSKGKEDNAFI